MNNQFPYLIKSILYIGKVQNKLGIYMFVSPVQTNEEKTKKYLPNYLYRTCYGIYRKIIYSNNQYITENINSSL